MALVFLKRPPTKAQADRAQRAALQKALPPRNFIFRTRLDVNREVQALMDLGGPHLLEIASLKGRVAARAGETKLGGGKGSSGTGQTNQDIERGLDLIRKSVTLRNERIGPPRGLPFGRSPSRRAQKIKNSAPPFRSFFNKEKGEAEQRANKRAVVVAASRTSQRSTRAINQAVTSGRKKVKSASSALPRLPVEERKSLLL